MQNANVKMQNEGLGIREKKRYKFAHSHVGTILANWEKIIHSVNQSFSQ